MQNITTGNNNAPIQILSESELLHLLLFVYVSSLSGLSLCEGLAHNREKGASRLSNKRHLIHLQVLNLEVV